MMDETDQFEQTLRHRDARKTMLISVGLLVVAAVFVLASVGACILVFVVVRDAEVTVRIPTAAIWGPPIGAFVFAAAGFKGLRDGIQKRRSALMFDQELRGA